MTYMLKQYLRYNQFQSDGQNGVTCSIREQINTMQDKQQQGKNSNDSRSRHIALVNTISNGWAEETDEEDDENDGDDCEDREEGKESPEEGDVGSGEEESDEHVLDQEEVKVGKFPLVFVLHDSGCTVSEILLLSEWVLRVGFKNEFREWLIEWVSRMIEWMNEWMSFKNDFQEWSNN